MSLDIRRWGVRQLVGSWAAYWVALAAAKLSPFALLVWQISRGPGEHGTVSASLSNESFVLTALKDGVTVYNATVPIVTAALWIAGPPLAIWLAWLVMRPSRAEQNAPLSGAALDALPDVRRDAWSERASRVPSPLPIERRENRG